MKPTPGGTNQLKEVVPVAPAGARDSVKPPTVLLIGEPGGGKTFSLASAARNKKLFAVLTEPGAEESLLDGAQHYGVPIENLHWHYIPPTSADWKALIDSATKINSMGYDDLTKLKSGINKKDYHGFIDVLKCLADFVCDRTGESYGPVDKLNDDCVVAVDSLTGINTMIRQTAVGGKPSMHQGEWGVAMDAQMAFTNRLTSATRCPTILTAHFEKQTNEMTGTNDWSVSVLGSKNTGKFPSQFSDCLWARFDTEKNKFLWASQSPKRPSVSGLKSRNLGMGLEFTPDFETIFQKYEARKAFASGATKTGQSNA